MLHLAAYIMMPWMAMGAPHPINIPSTQIHEPLNSTSIEPSAVKAQSQSQSSHSQPHFTLMT